MPYILQSVHAEEYLDEHEDYVTDPEEAKHFEDYDDAVAYKNDDEIVMNYVEGRVEPIS
jgi:hypothetical protein